MLNLSAEELKIIRHWAEKAETSPFPQETSLLKKVQRNPAYRGMLLSHKELMIVLDWADKETTGRYGTERYLLEQEYKLVEKIESYLRDEK